MPLCIPITWSSRKKRLNNEPHIGNPSETSSQQPALSSSADEYRHCPHELNVRSDLAISSVPTVMTAPTQLNGARGFSISGSPTFANIGVNSGVTNVINHGARTHAFDKMETFVSFAARHNSAEQDPDRQCHPGTRIAVLKRIQDWIDDPSTPERIFWLHGPAGAGKSAIAQTIARSNTQEKVAATFFFYRSDPNRNNGNRLFTTLAWQLAFSIPAVKKFIADALEKQPDLPRTDVETQFDQLIVRPFQMLKSDKPRSLDALPVVIIDGVDECADEKLQQRFLKVIGDAVVDSRLPLRFLICSRPEADIKGTIDRFQPPPHFIDLAKLDDANHDIEKYLKDEFSRIASERDLDLTLWPGEQAIQEVVFKSSGYFVFAATVIRCVGDPDNNPEALLDIILGLKPIRSTSPLALLDELYTEILRRQLDQYFLKTFLTLLVGRSSVQVTWDISKIYLAKDDAFLMNISMKELHIKLRRMRSLLSFEPHIAVYHRSFIDFLIEPSRSNQYHVSREGGITRYLELIVDWIVQYAARVIEQPDDHQTYHFRPQFVSLLGQSSSKIPLPVEGWQSVLQPLLQLQDKLLILPNFISTWNVVPCNECFPFYTMRCLLLRLTILQRFSYATAESAGKHVFRTPLTSTVIERNGFEMDLDDSLSSLLTCLRNSQSVESSSTKQTIDLMRALARFKHGEVAAKVLSVADAQDLMDVIDHIINDEKLLDQFRLHDIRQAIRLALKLLAKAPVIPRSLLKMNSPLSTLFSKDLYESSDETIETFVHTMIMGRFLNQNFFLPLFWRRDKSMSQWGESTGGISSSGISSIKKTKAMLAVARAFQYFQSLHIRLDGVTLENIFLDSEFCARIWLRWVLSDLEESLTFESNIFSFGCFYYEIYFNVKISDSDRRQFKRDVIVRRPLFPRIRDDAWRLIQRCCAEDPNSRPTIDEVVQEMEPWTLV